MPISKREIEPIFISRGVLPPEFTFHNELEAVCNGMLSNVIRQLANLSKHSEDMFSELINEANSYFQRIKYLQERIDRVSMKVTQLNSNVEEVSLKNILSRKAFSSSSAFDQQVIDRASMPTAMVEKYLSCDKPPSLDLLNVYRDDGKDGLKFYTDPNYFFDLWSQEMLKDTEKIMHDKNKKHFGMGETRDFEINKTKSENMNRPKKKTRSSQLIYEDERKYKNQEHVFSVSPCNQFFYNNPSHQQNREMERSIGSNSSDLKSNSILQNGININSSYRNDYVTSYPDTTDASYLHDVPSVTSVHIPSRTLSRAAHRPSQPPPAPPNFNCIYANGNVSAYTSDFPNKVKISNRIARTSSLGRESLPPPPPPPPIENLFINFSTKNMTSENSVVNISAANSINKNEIVLKQTSSDLDSLPPVLISPKEDMPKMNIVQCCTVPLTDPSVPPPPPLPSSIHNEQNYYKSENAIPKISIKNSTKEAVKNLGMLESRSDLLKAIRDGIKLRKVENSKAREVEKNQPLHDVASILARRVAIEFSDSESSSDNDESNEGWDEEPEKSKSMVLKQDPHGYIPLRCNSKMPFRVKPLYSKSTCIPTSTANFKQTAYYSKKILRESALELKSKKDKLQQMA